YAIRLVQQRALRSALSCVILGAVPCAVGVAITNVLGYTDTRYGLLLLVKANPVAFNHLGWMLVLSFGPLLFGALAALARGRWLLANGARAPARGRAPRFSHFFE